MFEIGTVAVRVVCVGGGRSMPSFYLFSLYINVFFVAIYFVSNTNVEKQIQHITMHVREVCPGQVNIYI